jgi:hypothetical protein
VSFGSLGAPELVDLPYNSRTAPEQQQPKKHGKEDVKMDKQKQKNDKKRDEVKGG